MHHCMPPNCTYVSLSPIVLAALNLIQRGVGEVEFLRSVVDRQAVGGSDVAPDNDKDVCARQCGAHDAGRLLIPVGPEHEAAEENTFEKKFIVKMPPMPENSIIYSDN